jgi:sortase A
MSEVLFTTRSRRPRRGRGARRAWRALAIALIAVGALALLDAGVTLVWQEPFSALYAKFRQDHLNGTLRAAERATPTAVERRALASLPDERHRVAFLASELQHHAPNGSAVGRIVIPKIDASYVVVKGTDTSDLESGPGVYSETNFPGIAGTTAIAGHRTTYLAPFRDINELSPGNHILLEMPYAHFTYTVIGQRVVLPTDVSAAVSNVGYTRLVLSACTPLFSAAKRLLVYARLTKTVPVGAARVLGGRVYQPSLIQPIVSTQATPPHGTQPARLPTLLRPMQPRIPAAL